MGHGSPPAELILGIYDGTHDAGAALVRHGQLVAACNEERFNRRKAASGWPAASIRTCLAAAGVRAGQVEQVAIAGLVNPNPGLRLLRPIQRRWELSDGFFYTEGDGPLARLSQWVQFDSPFPHTRSDHLVVRAYLPALRGALHRRLRAELRAGAASGRSLALGADGWSPGERPPAISFHDHHRCHAGGAYLTGGRGDVLVVVADGVGDGQALTVWRGRDGGLSLLGAMAHPHSYGLLYATITGFLGFRPFRHENKLTGLAPLGDPDAVTVAFPFEGPPDDRRFTQRFGPSLRPWLDGLRAFRREDVCAWLQRGLEQELGGLVRAWLDRTGCRDLALAGGVFANVQLNYRISRIPGLRSMTVFPHMGDGGLAAGAALVAWADAHPGAKVPPPLAHAFLGPAFDEGQAEAALTAAGLRGRRLPDLEEEVARRLARGQIVARFDGPMEFGPRALGNRSILAPAHPAGIAARLNDALRRSDFMPFAPAILAEEADAWVEDLDVVRETAAFMTVNVRARPALALACPAGVHVDRSLRPQLVRAEVHPGLHRILRAYHHLTGIPAIINTSFNMHEEPIVCTPEEAIHTFLRAGLDALALGPFLVTR